MLEQQLHCLTDSAEVTRPLYAIRPAGLATFLDSLPESQRAFLHQLDFTGKAQELQFLPAEHGIAGAVLGLGDETSPNAFGNLAYRLPEDSIWQLQQGDYDIANATLGFCLGAYRYTELKPVKRRTARLLTPPAQERSCSAAAAAWMAGKSGRRVMTNQTSAANAPTIEARLSLPITCRNTSTASGQAQ